MPIHLVGFLEDIDSGGVFANLNSLADQTLFTTVDAIRVPELNRVIMVAGGADGVVDPRIRFDSPTLDAMVRPEIAPINVQDAAAVEPDSPHKLMKMLENPWTLGIDENLECELNNDPAAVQDQWALLWLADGPVNPIVGANVFTVRATSNTAAVANEWTSVAIALDEALPPGDYDLVGLHAMSAGMIATRVNFLTEQRWRPGCLGVDVITDLADPIFRAGRLGLWGTFPFTQIPLMDVLCVSADAVQTFHLDLIKR